MRIRLRKGSVLPCAFALALVAAGVRPAVSQGIQAPIDADTVDTFHASGTQVPGKLLALDAGGRFPHSTIAACADGQILKHLSGAWGCGADGVGSYVAGPGLVLSGATFSADLLPLGGESGMAATVARSDHFHDARYFREFELQFPGTINMGTNPVDWTRLKGVPTGFADGVDDVSSGPATDLVCTGCVGSTDLGDGQVAVVDLAFDPATQSELDALGVAGTINLAANPIDWTKLKGVPAGFADGVDDGGGIATDLVCTGCVGSTDLGDGQVAVADLAFDPATQSELDALGVAGTINLAGNPMDWTKLKGVPAGFADGVDDISSGPATDLVCAGCVHTTDLADGAVTGAKIADGQVAVADLAFDPATQGELDALALAGTINFPGNPVDWTRLKGVPAGFADGLDDAGIIVIDGVPPTAAVAIGAACTNSGAQVTVAVPSSGKVVVESSPWIFIEHRTGTLDAVWVMLGTSPADCTAPANTAGVNYLPAALPSSADYAVDLHTIRVFDVAAGTHTFYLNGLMTSGASPGDLFYRSNLTAVFYPG